MKSIELMATGIRVLGLFILIYAVRSGVQQYQTIQYVGSISQDDIKAFTYMTAAQTVLLVCMALLMLKFPLSVSRWLLPKAKADEVIFDGKAHDIEVCAFVIIGVYILSWAIPDLLNNAIWLWYAAYSDISRMWEPGGGHRYLIALIVTAFEIAIGLYLCVRARGLSTMLRSLREAGTR